MNTIETTAFWLTLFATGSGLSLGFVIWLIRKPIKPYDTEFMVDHSEQQRTIITRGNTTTEI
jgi:hypothetical protein